MAFSPHRNVTKNISQTGQNSDGKNTRQIAFARMAPHLNKATQAIAWRAPYNNEPGGRLMISYSKDTYSGDYLGRAWKTVRLNEKISGRDAISACATKTQVQIAYIKYGDNSAVFNRSSLYGFHADEDPRNNTIGTPFSDKIIREIRIVPSPDQKECIIFYVQGSYLVAQSPARKFSTQTIQFKDKDEEVNDIDVVTRYHTSYITLATSRGLLQIRFIDGDSSDARFSSTITRIRSTVYTEVRTAITGISDNRFILANNPSTGTAHFIYQDDTFSWKSAKSWLSSAKAQNLIYTELGTYGSKVAIYRTYSDILGLVRTTVDNPTSDNPTFEHLRDPFNPVSQRGFFAINKPILFPPTSEGGYRKLRETDQVAWMNKADKTVKVYPTEAAPNWKVIQLDQSPTANQSIEIGAPIQYAWIKQNKGGIDLREKSTIAGRNLSQSNLLAAQRDGSPIFYDIQAGFDSKTAYPYGNQVKYEMLWTVPGNKTPFGLSRGDTGKFQLYNVEGIVPGGGAGFGILDDDIVVGVASRNTFWQSVALPDKRLILIRAFAEDGKTGLKWALYGTDPNTGIKDWKFWFNYNSVNQPYWSDFGDSLPAVGPSYTYIPLTNNDGAGVSFRVKEYPTGTVANLKKDIVLYYLDLIPLSSG